jgi:hypothetical protein
MSRRSILGLVFRSGSAPRRTTSATNRAASTRLGRPNAILLPVDIDVISSL